MHKKAKVSLVIPAYNEEATIASVIDDYQSQENIDEIVVIDNNSKDNTYEIATEKGVTVIKEMKQGYGHALRTGLDNASGEIIILTEADGSFRSSDIHKFLAYMDDAEMVIGTRTVKQLVYPGARMNFIIRTANVIWAKFLELLWFIANETRFTDVGCTYRAIWRSAYETIRPGLRATGPDFSPEMMAEALLKKVKIVEIPVKYFPRLGGESKHSISYYHLTKTALKMLRAIINKRISP